MTALRSEAGAAGTVGLLHTVPALAARFDADVAEAVPGLHRVHLVDERLLAAAVAGDPVAQIEAGVLGHVRHLAAVGAQAVLVTCSSLGDATDAAARSVLVPVLRVDRSMAGEAVGHATTPGARGRIAVLATLPSTLGPTGRLIDREARAVEPAGTVEVLARLVDGAAAARATGDVAHADRLVADAVTRAAAEADVVVLAQASMAEAAGLARCSVPVLTSPAGGVADLVRTVQGSGRKPGGR